MIKIHVRNSVCRFEGIEINLFSRIRDLLRYRNPEYEFHVARGRRTGRMAPVQEWLHLTDFGSHEFPSGLLSCVCGYLDEHNIPFQMIDERVLPKERRIYRFYEQPFPMRPFQQYVYDLIEDIPMDGEFSLIGNHHGTISLPTGLGKSLLAAYIIQKLGQETLFVVPSTGLVTQTIDTFTKLFSKKVVGRHDTEKPIIVANYQALVKKPKEYFERFRLLMNDEAHHSSSESIFSLNKDRWNSIFYRYNLSVAGNSNIILKHENKVISTTFEDYFRDIPDSLYLDISERNLETISFNNKTKSFEWDKITHILKYLPQDKQMYKIKARHLTDLTITEDHSVYIVERMNPVWVNNFKVFTDFKVVKKMPDQIKKGDILLYNSQMSIDESEFKIDIFDYIPDSYLLQANCLFNSSLEELNELKRQKIITSSQKYSYQHQKYGGIYIPLKYKKNRKQISKIYFTGRTSTVCSRHLSMNMNLAYLVGFFIADGHLVNGEIGKVGLSAHIKDVEIISQILSYLGIKYYVKSATSSDKLKYIIACSPWLYFFFKSFYCRHDSIRLPDWCFKLNRQLKLAFFAGYIRGDGCRHFPGSFSCVSKSKGLLYDLVLLTKLIGYPTRLQFYFGPDFNGNIREYGRLYISTKIPKTCCQIPMLSNFKAVKITSIEKTNYQSHVYDFTVKNNHNFTANNILVSNSATPYRNDGTDLKMIGVIGDMIYHYPLAQAVRDGWICRPVFFFYPIENNEVIHCQNFMEEYKAYIVNNDSRNALIVKLAKSLAKNKRQTLILVKEIEHGQRLNEMIEGSVFIQGEQSKKGLIKNKKILADFQNCVFQTLIATSVVGEGTDTKSADTIINAGGMKAKSDIIQKVGRALRIMEGKPYALIIDFLDNNTKHLSNHSIERMKHYSGYETEIKVISDEN